MLIEKEDAIKAVCEACYMYKYIGEHYKECKYYPCDDVTALEAVPEAPKPTGELIARADAIEAVTDIQDGSGQRYYLAVSLVDKIRSLPSAEAVEYESTVTLNSPISISAEAVQGWRTGKPTKGGKYIVTLIGIGGYRFVTIMHYDKPLMPNIEVGGACWHRDDDEWGDVVYDDNDILAWMPLPTPYKGGDDK